MGERNIILIPTHDKSLIHWNEDNHYFVTKKPTYAGTNYHLYITMKDNLEKGELVLYHKSIFLIEHIFVQNDFFGKTKIVGKFIKDMKYGEFNSISKLNKIISTTNTGLNNELCNLPFDFLEKVIMEYNKGNSHEDILDRNYTIKLLKSLKIKK